MKRPIVVIFLIFMNTIAYANDVSGTVGDAHKNVSLVPFYSKIFSRLQRGCNEGLRFAVTSAYRMAPYREELTAGAVICLMAIVSSFLKGTDALVIDDPGVSGVLLQHVLYDCLDVCPEFVHFCANQLGEHVSSEGKLSSLIQEQCEFLAFKVVETLQDSQISEHCLELFGGLNN